MPAHQWKREFTQCQHCFKSKGPGVTLSLCAGCKIDTYCVRGRVPPLLHTTPTLTHPQSKECQRAAWPTHKARCRAAQATRASIGDASAATLDALRAFTAKHRPVIAECGVRALADGGAADDGFLQIDVRRRPGEARAERAWAVEDVRVAPYASVPDAHAAQMRAVLAQRVPGTAGAFFAVVRDVESGLANSAPIGYTAASLGGEKMPWKQVLVRSLNAGLVV
ncbi:zinc finger MYND domain-containing protein [Phanerochaete sordida]|uniref:Zinc finger MYND domain-containing protein n=1 Tax=Phanerochaete sordida TaxID=48140 RepID=A0A9P3LCN8_9APHY|nr:zinc finger MYND domain-containing protein [Phanerochaete sordida]